MKFFNAKIILNSCLPLEADGEYEISADIVDNSGMFFASDVKPTDIIYINGSTLGKLLLRYKVIEVKSHTGTTISAVIKWDLDEDETIEPPSGIDGIIGELIDEVGTSMISSIFINSCDESVITAARNYEQKLISLSLKDINSKVKFPSLGYSVIEKE